MEDKFRIEIDMEQDLCYDCKKTSPEYYELKLQLRCKYFEDLEEIKTFIFNLIDKNFTTINKMHEVENGFDFFFRSKGESSKISTLFHRRYLIEEKRSKKIIGQNFLESKSIFRHNLLINIINLERGDKISIKGTVFSIKAINHNDLILINEINRSKKVISYRFAKDYLELVEKIKK